MPTALALAGGDLVPVAQGWKSRQQELVRAHLSSPSEHLAGTTRLHAILTERVEWWLDSQRSETRRQLLASLANRLLSPVALPGEAANPFPPLRWLLERLGEGVPLTQTRNLGQKFVRAAAICRLWLLRAAILCFAPFKAAHRHSRP